VNFFTFHSSAFSKFEYSLVSYFSRMLRCILSLFILLSVQGYFIPLLAQSISLTLPVQSVQSGATQIDIPVQLSGSASVGAIQFAFTYDANELEYVGPVLAGSLMAGRNMIFNGATAGEVRAGFATGSAISLSNGVLCYVRFNRIVPAPLSYLVWNRNPNTTFMLQGNGIPIASLQTISGVIFPQGVTTTTGTTNGNQVVCELDTARLSIAGSNATQYQWYFSTDTTATEFLPVNASNYQAGPFAGEQSPLLVLPNVLQNQQTGIYYFCRLTSAQGTMLSRAQLLTVDLNNIINGVGIIANPPLPLCSGASTQFRLSVPVPVVQARWQWAVDGFPVGNDSVLFLQNPTAGQVISCELRGANCAYSTADITLVLSAAPSVFPTTGGGTTCSRGPRLAVGISGSQIGARYVLLRNGTSTGDTLNGTGQARPFPSQLLVGNYKVLALSAGGCTRLFPDSVVINHYPVISKSVSPNCTLILGGSTILNATGGVSAQSYQWFPAIGLSSTQGATVVASPQQTTLYSVSIEDFFGCRDTLTVVVTVLTSPPQSVVFSVRCLLEGLYVGSGLMRPGLFLLGLTSQSDAADSLEVGLWNPNALSVPVWRDTVVVNTSGLAGVVLPAGFRNNSYFISVRSRNSLETWSAAPVLVQDSLVYDLSTVLSSAYSNGSNSPMKLLSGGRFGLYAGDINRDGAIDISDLSAIWTSSFGSPAPAYVVTDLSGDGIPDITDISLVWSYTFNSLFYARP
jgi:hypothetical protein